METTVVDYGYVKTVYLDGKPIFDICDYGIFCVSEDRLRATAKFKLKCLK